MATKKTKQNPLTELLYQALETEIGGQKIYETALRCAINEDLKKEWQKYLEETRHHEQVLRELFEKLELDTEAEVPGRLVVRHIAISLVKAMEMALAAGDPEAAQLVAAECVIQGETKDHQNWELLGKFADKRAGKEKKALMEAYKEVESQEDEHLYHSKGWSRELWLEFLGIPAVLPPPEEIKKVETAIGAARAEQAREQMLP